MTNPYLRGFLFAARFLTRVPLPDPGTPSSEEMGRAALFYPAVGVLIGGLLAIPLALLWLLPWPTAEPVLSVLPAAALLLVCWVWLTGALHLDGLADCADAWVGGLGSRKRTLEILKDPRAGSMAVVVIVLLLLLKFAALAVLVQLSRDDLSAALWVLLWVPVLARGQLLVLARWTPYARSSGMGSAMAEHLPRRAAMLVVASIWGFAILSGGMLALGMLIAAAWVYWAWRNAMLNRLGGFTGDTAGALVEMTEAAMLLLVAYLI